MLVEPDIVSTLKLFLVQDVVVPQELGPGGITGYRRVDVQGEVPGVEVEGEVWKHEPPQGKDPPLRIFRVPEPSR